MSRSAKLFLLFGIIFAIAASYATYTAISRLTAPPPSSAVVVAAMDIPPRTQITAGELNRLLTVQRIDAKQVPAGALTDPSQAVGQTTRDPIAAGEVMVTSRLVSPNTQAGAAGLVSAPAMSAVLPRDNVAMTITVEPTTNVAGAVRPDDHIDIFVTIPLPRPGGTVDYTTDLFMQDVRVLAVGEWTGSPAAPNSYGLMTLVLPRQQAAELQHLRVSGATLGIVLRRFDDSQEAHVEQVDSQYVVRRFGLLPRPPVPPDLPTPTPIPGAAAPEFSPAATSVPSQAASPASVSSRTATSAPSGTATATATQG